MIVHTLDEVNNWLNQGLYFFKDIREQGIELFSEGTPRTGPAGQPDGRRETRHLAKAF
ncbi:hypothetical protein P4S72_08645 [Vibrio sp. PP-XX7]